MPDLVATCSTCRTRLSIVATRAIRDPVVCPVCGMKVDLTTEPGATPLGSTDPTLTRAPLGAETPALRAPDERTEMDGPSGSPRTLINPGKTDGQARAGFANPALANYELLGELGRGGVGVVYKARHRQLQRLVALKVILAGAHAGPAAVVRFRQEAETIARLHHPHIVQIYEIGEHEGLPFIALELCPGGTLAGRLRSGPWTPRAAAALVEKLARAVQVAHEAGIIHRDLKPGNILIAADDQPRIGDFGLAKKLDDAGLTQAGAVMGTPSYMAPEQASGDSSRISPATDIYALGAILYELLTGRPPFHASTSGDTLVQVIFEDPVPPVRLQPKLPRDMETICLKCLRKEPGLRYSSALALAEDLRRFQAGEAISARPVGPLERAWRWCRRNPAVAALLALVLATLVLGSGVAWLFAWQATQEAASARAARDEAERQREAAEQQRLRADWLVYAGNLREAQLALDSGNRKQARQRLEECRWDFRGWEHSYLWTRLHAKTHGWQESQPLTCVAVSCDGKLLASATEDGQVKLRDLEKDTLVRAWKVERGIGSLVFSPDGKVLAGGSENPDRWGWLHPVPGLGESKPGEIRLWDVKKGDQLLVLRGHQREVTALAFGRMPNLLASGCHDGTIKIWDLKSGKEVHTLRGHEGAVSCVHFDNRLDNRLYSTGFDGTIRIWDVVKETVVNTIRGHAGMVLALAFGPFSSGALFATGGEDLTVKFWDAEGQLVRTLRGHDGFITALEKTREGRLLSASADQTLRIWDEAFSQELLTIKAHAKLIVGLAGNCSGRMASVSEDGWLRLWEANQSPASRPLYGHAGQVLCAALCPQVPLVGPGAVFHLASGGEDRTVKLWDLRTGQPSYTFPPLEARVTAVAWRGDGTQLACGCADGTIQIWNINDRQSVQRWRGHDSVVHGLAYSPDGKRLLSGAGDAVKGTGEVKLWDARTGAELAAVLEPAGRVLQVAFSPDGKWALARSGDWEKAISSVRLLNAQSGQVVRTFPGRQGYLTGATFLSEGRELATAVRDREKSIGSIHFIELDTGQEIRTWSKGMTPPASLAASPDGKQLVCGHEDGSLSVWDVTTGERKRLLQGDGEAIIGVGVGPRHIFSLTHDGSCRLWE